MLHSTFISRVDRLTKFASRFQTRHVPLPLLTPLIVLNLNMKFNSLIVVIVGCCAIIGASSNVIPGANLDKGLTSEDVNALLAEEGQLGEHNRQRRIIINIYRGPPPNSGGLSSGISSLSSSLLGGASNANEGSSATGTGNAAVGTGNSPFGGLSLRTGRLLTPETRATLSAFGRNLLQRGQTFYQNTRTALAGRTGAGSGVGSLGSFGGLSSTSSGSFGSAYLNSNSTAGIGALSANPQAIGGGLRLNLITPQTRETLRGLGTRVGQRVGTMLQFVQAGAARLAARTRARASQNSLTANPYNAVQPSLPEVKAATTGGEKLDDLLED